MRLLGHLFPYLRFCTREEKKIENKKNEKSYKGNVINTDVTINHFRCIVYLRAPVCEDISLLYILTS